MSNIPELSGKGKTMMYEMNNFGWCSLSIKDMSFATFTISCYTTASLCTVWSLQGSIDSTLYCSFYMWTKTLKMIHKIPIFWCDFLSFLYVYLCMCIICSCVVIFCEWTQLMQMHFMCVVFVCIMRTALTRQSSSLSRPCVWLLTTTRLVSHAEWVIKLITFL